MSIELRERYILAEDSRRAEALADLRIVSAGELRIEELEELAQEI